MKKASWVRYLQRGDGKRERGRWRSMKKPRLIPKEDWKSWGKESIGEDSFKGLSSDQLEPMLQTYVRNPGVDLRGIELLTADRVGAVDISHRTFCNLVLDSAVDVLTAGFQFLRICHLVVTEETHIIEDETPMSIWVITEAYDGVPGINAVFAVSICISDTIYSCLNRVKIPTARIAPVLHVLAADVKFQGIRSFPSCA